MSDYTGWHLDNADAMCPDCDELVSSSGDLDELLTAIDHHTENCTGLL